MADLLIIRALPNPAGKDRTPANQVTNDQLNGEWTEFRNNTQQVVAMNGVRLSHYTFNNRCDRTGEDALFTFGNTLAVGYSIRVHTGRRAALQDGVIWHLFLNRANFVWNNTCGDTVVLRNAVGTVVDWASYNANPPEGIILDRVPGSNQLAAYVLAGRR